MVELKVPDDKGLSEKVTVPVGVIVVPELESVTVAVQVVAVFTAGDAGEQTTTVELVRLAAVIVLKPELAEWSVSPP